MSEDNKTGGETRPETARAGLAAFLLTGVGGWVDAVGFVMLGHLFTANMSGNSVQFAAYFGLGQFRVSMPCLLAIPVFMAGIFLGTVAMERSRAKRPERGVYAVEAVMLAGLAAALWMKGGQDAPDTTWAAGSAELLALLAMGLQNATVRRLGHINLNTTYITNLLQACAQQGARAWVARRAGDAATGAVAGRESWLAARLWFIYAAGALTGAALVVGVSPLTMLLPAAALAMVTAGILK